MGAYSNYTIELKGSQEDIDEAKVLLEEAADSSDCCSNETGNTIDVQEDYEFVYVEDIIDNLAIPLAQKVPELSFIIKGDVDMSESNGQHMGFLIKYENKRMTVQVSDWYWEMCASYYESYEDLCNDYHEDDGSPIYTKEQYQQLQADGLWFVLENEAGGKIVQKLPLSEAIDISVEIG